MLYNLIHLQRLTLVLNPRKNLLPWRRKWTSEPFLGEIPTWFQTRIQTQSHALILTHSLSLFLGRRIFWGNPLLYPQEALSMSLKDQTSPEETSPREPEPNKTLKENQMCETTTKAKPKLWIIRKNREQNQQQRKNWELCEGLPLHPFIEDSIIEMFSTLRWEVLMLNTHCRCQKMFDHDSWSNR